MMTNQEIAKILKEISLFLEMDEVQFKPRAYEEAAHTIERVDKELSEIYKEGGLKALDDLPGIGVAISEKIEELLKTGKLGYYNKLKRKYPIDILELSAIEGIGPKMIKKLYQKLKIKNIKDLEKAIEQKKLEKLPGLGKKTGENILKSVAFLKKSGDRFILGEIYPEIDKLTGELKKVKGVNRLEVAGSVRRMKETIGDLDLVAVAGEPKKLMDKFTSLSQVKQVVAHGRTKSMVRLKNGLDVDLRAVPEKSFGAALLYFTGNRDHHIELRKMALKKKYTLNEYGLFTHDKKRRFIAGRTEESIYKALGLKYMPPEMREMTGELDLAQKGKIPRLVGYNDLKGDLQIQTNWTDGSASIEETAKAAKELGLEYICITDHTKSLAFAGGCDEKKLKRQMKEIDKLNKKFKGKPYILKGAEVNIMKDGSLDIKDEVLKQLDVAGAAVHSNFKMTKKQMTERICRAMQNPHIDILFHPTGRIIGKRPAYELDIDEIIKVAKKTKTVLEINSAPDRLDLKDSHIKKAVEAGVKMAIDSDAHDPSHFGFLWYGIGQARRGWARKSDIINVWPREKMLSMLK